VSEFRTLREADVCFDDRFLETIAPHSKDRFWSFRGRLATENKPCSTGGSAAAHRGRLIFVALRLEFVKWLRRVHAWIVFKSRDHVGGFL
jgi:hypothetical protein